MQLIRGKQMNHSFERELHAEVYAEPEADLVFITGDQDAGLIVTGHANMARSFDFQGVKVQTKMRAEIQQPDLMVITLQINPEKPMRFRVEWLVPEDAKNAAMTLNGGLLIAPFSTVFPAGGLPVPRAACGQANPVSTLHPGQFQSINFVWQAGDQLKLFLVFSA